MEYPYNPNKSELPPRVDLSRPQPSSEALQDLIDILKQNYVSDCPDCKGTGYSFNNRVCEPCKGLGKSLDKR